VILRLGGAYQTGVYFLPVQQKQTNQYRNDHPGDGEDRRQSVMINEVKIRIEADIRIRWAI